MVRYRWVGSLGALSVCLGACSNPLPGAGAGAQPSAAATATTSPLALKATPAAGSSPAPTIASTVDFGDDSGKYSRDGECDDPRFAGAGMTDTPLLDEDIRHDATDCRSAFNQGRLTLRANGEAPSSQATYAESGVDHVIWGDDAGKYARDGECDDKRFSGAGMTDTPLLDTDIKHDATDCRSAFRQGRLQLRE